MVMQRVKGYFRKARGGRKHVDPYRRKRRRTATKRMIGNRPVKLYPIRDEYGQVRGFSNKPPRSRKA